MGIRINDNYELLALLMCVELLQRKKNNKKSDKNTSSTQICGNN